MWLLYRSQNDSGSINILFSFKCYQRRIFNLIREIIKAITLSIYVRSCAVQSASKGVCVSERHRYYIHPQFIHLLLLRLFAFLYQYCFMVKHKAVH